MKARVPRLQVITDTRLQARYSHAALARLAAEGGTDGLQFRQKSGATRKLLENAETARKVCRERGVTFIVNDRVDIALAADADGVHLGQDDFPAAAARRILGDDKLIGVTAFTGELARRAFEDGADYVGFGPIFGTQSKPNARPATGIEGLRDFAERAALPVVAIGGIRAEHVAELIDAGAHGCAVISAICCAEDVTEATREFIRRLPGDS